MAIAELGEIKILRIPVRDRSPKPIGNSVNRGVMEMLSTPGRNLRLQEEIQMWHNAGMPSREKTTT